jgi:EAL domain-containing protein (putative c-di-GMP-specific phosphodiesterase class I)
VIGFEALARWEHPERGLLSPAAFVPVAEQGETIHELGTEMLRAACAAATWPARVSVSVNVSARQLRLQLVTEVAEVIEGSGIEPGRLELELTETALLDGPGAGAVLESLRGLGGRLALDDFGTGWSSLEVAQRLQAHTVKIDRTFVSRLGARGRETGLITAMVTMARALGARAIAEGIETQEQHDRLVELGVEVGQGFLYSKPLPAAELPDLLRAAG